MKLRKRWLAGAVLVLLLAAPLVLLTSETVLRGVAAQVEARVPGLALEGVSGRLASGVSIARVVWRDGDAMVVTIDELRTSWRLLPALMGRAHITELRAERVEVALRGTTTQTARPASGPARGGFEMPLPLRLDALDIRELVVTRDNFVLLQMNNLLSGAIRAEGRRAQLGSLDATWTLSIPDTPDLTGALALLDGSHDRIPFVATTTDGMVRLHGALSQPLANRTVDAQLQLEDFPLHEWADLDAALLVTGDFALQGWVEDLTVLATMTLSSESLPSTDIQMEAAWGAELLVIRSLETSVAGMLGRFEGSGRYAWDGGLPSGRLRGHWTGLRLRDDIASTDGTLSMDLQGSTLQVTADGQLGDEPVGRVRGEGRVAWPIDIRDLRGSAEVRWADLRVAGMHSPEGLVSATGGVDGWRAELQRITGTFNEWTFDMEGLAQGQGTTLRQVDVNANVGDAEAHISGTLDEILNLDWRVRIPDLAVLAPQTSGRLRAEGTLRGTVEQPELEFELESDRLRWADIRVESARGAGAVKLAAGEDNTARLHIRGLQLAGQRIGELTASLSGKTEDLSLELSAHAEGLDANLQIRGAWQESTLTGSLVNAQFHRQGYTRWILTGPAGLSLSTSAIRLNESCWTQAASTHSLCASGHWAGPDGIAATAQLRGLPLQALSAWLPVGFIFEGMVDGQAALVWEPEAAQPRISLDLSVDEGAWKQETPDGVVALIAWNSVSLEAGAHAGDLQGAFRFALADGGTLDATLSMPIADNAAGERGERPVAARFKGQFTDFNLIPALIPDVGTVTGQFDADLVMEGTLNNPQFRGEFVIADGVMTLPRLGLRLTDMEFELEGGRDLLAVRAQTRSGEGVMSITGIFAVRDGKLIGGARLEGEDFQASATPEAQVVIAPRIDITIEGHTIRIDGDLRVPRAQLAPNDFTTVVQRSDDEILIDDGVGDGLEERWRIHTRIRMRLGDVSFDGFGLTGLITGGLTAVDEPGQQTTATGELQIQEGRYAAWGQALEIERGRLIFTGGPITQPGLDIRAVRRPRDVMVGVNVRGTLRAPELSLISEPGMQQAELLSWLVLGMPLAQTSGAEQQLLNRTARSASLAGGELLARELGRRLGISEVGIEHGLEPDQAALVIGHYFSPRVYVGYGIGLFESTNSLRLRFHLNRNWSVEVETSEEASSTDLKYTIER